MSADRTSAFETRLVAIGDVQAEEPSKAHDEPATSDDPSGAKEGQDDQDENKDESDSKQPDQPGTENGECRLLGPFALFVQAGLGFLALLSLVWKRWRERPRRPLKVWFFDASKQVVGSALLHLLNVLMSTISSEDYQLASAAKKVSDNTGRQPNPCSFYLINIAVDVSNFARRNTEHCDS